MHVAPCLSEQERRQFIGNDKVVIYFTEEPFEPNFRGNVNSVGIVVRVARGETDKYRVSCFYRKRVTRFSPYLPDKMVEGKELRDVLFLNGKKIKIPKLFFFSFYTLKFQVVNGTEGTSRSFPYSNTVDALFDNELATLALKYKEQKKN